MYPEANKANVLVQEVPELQRVIERLTRAVDMNTEMAYSLGSKLSQITHDMGNPVMDTISPKAPAPSTALEELHNIICKLENNNEGLKSSHNHLSRII